MFTGMREQFATWLGAMGVLLLIGAITALAMGSGMPGTLSMAGLGVVLLAAAFLLLRSRAS